MADVYVSSTGDNGDDGSTYALAKATIEGARAVASQGDTIRVVADGDHPMVAVVGIPFSFAGTNHTTDPGVVITGCTSNLTPTIATVAATGVTNTKWIKIGSTAKWLTVSGINFDYTALVALTPASMRPVELSGQTWDHRLLDCEVRLTADVGDAITPTVLPEFPYYAGASAAHAATGFEVARCVLVNAQLRGATIVDQTPNYHHNVVLLDGSGYSNSALGMSWTAGASTARRFYNNTMVMRRYSAENGVPVVNCAGDDTAVVVVHSNLLFLECGPTASNGMAGAAMDGHSGATQTAAVTTGYDLVALGANMTTHYSGWTAVEPGLTSYQYNEVWRGGGTGAGTNVETNTDLLTNQSLSDVFNSTTTAYTWTPDVFSHDLPMDYRPIVGKTTAYDGTTAGALPRISDVIIPVGGGGIVYEGVIDSLPFYQDVYRADLLGTLRVRRNNNFEHINVRHFLDDKVHGESTSRIVEVPATSGRVAITLGGVAQTEAVIVETDQTVAVSFIYNNGVANATFVASVNGVCAFDQAPVVSLVLNNTSSTTATVNVAVFD